MIDNNGKAGDDNNTSHSRSAREVTPRLRVPIPTITPRPALPFIGAAVTARSLGSNRLRPARMHAGIRRHNGASI